MFYYDEASTDIEDIIMDFLVYRKNKRQPEINTQGIPETSSQREDYKPLEIIQEYLSQEDRAIRMEGTAFVNSRQTEMQTEIQNEIQNEMQAKKQTEMQIEKQNEKQINSRYDKHTEKPFEKLYTPLPGNTFDNVSDSEAEYMHLHYSEINKKLHKYIELVINEYEYVGSPAFDDYIHMDTINKMVDKAVELASKDIFEINEIKSEMHRHQWTPHRILKACMEALLLNELFYKRKLMYTSVSDFTKSAYYL